MDPARWRKIDELVDGALELPAAEREDYLTARCDGDDSLQREVLSLLRAQDGAQGFLENSALEVAASMRPRNSSRFPHVASGPGDRHLSDRKTDRTGRHG